MALMGGGESIVGCGKKKPITNVKIEKYKARYSSFVDSRVRLIIQKKITLIPIKTCTAYFTNSFEEREQQSCHCVSGVRVTSASGIIGSLNYGKKRGD